jgi:glycosyltransferase involved in cell wall biosynthesis
MLAARAYVARGPCSVKGRGDLGRSLDVQVMKRLVEHVLHERTRRLRRPPALRTGPQAGPPTIYYLTPDNPEPSGGIRVAYRHVDILNDAGMDAVVVHHREGFTSSWFEHSTPIVGAPSVRLGPEDVLVVPEYYGPYLDRLPRGPRRVIFNQNAYLTFARVPAGEPLAYDGVVAAMTVSPDSAEYLRFAFPGLDVSVVRNAIDPAIFHPGTEPPGRRIALMPRKRPDDVDQVLRLLGDRLRGWEVVTIDGASERETAALMRSSAIFLAFGQQEGFGVPPTEAMASGCYVIGFPAFGGREIFDPDVSRPVEDGDVLAFAREVEQAIWDFERDPAAIRQAGARAAEHIRTTYSPERQRDELLDFMAGVLSGARRNAEQPNLEAQWIS